MPHLPSPTKEELARLSEIINLLNDRFGTDFTEADKLFFDQIEEEMVLDEKLGLQAQTNTIDNFKYGFEEVFDDKMVERIDHNYPQFTAGIKMQQGSKDKFLRYRLIANFCRDISNN